MDTLETIYSRKSIRNYTGETIRGAVMAMAKNEKLIAELQLPENFVPLCGIALGKTQDTYKERSIDMNRIGTNYLG